MTRLAVALVGVFAVVSGACVTMPVTPPKQPGGAIIDGEGRPITDAEFRGRIAGASFVVIGERHDVPCDHAVQARLVGALAAHDRWALGLESIDVAHQDALDRLNQGDLLVPELAAALDWPKTWGFPFALTSPLLDAAVQTKTPVYALNAPRELAKQVGTDGLAAVPPALGGVVTKELVPPLPEQAAMLREAFGAHAQGGADPAAFERFVRVQSFWDSQMAFRAVQAAEAEARPVIVIAGGGHVRRGWGIPHQLAQFAPGKRVVTLMPWDPATPRDPTEADFLFACETPADEAPLR